MADPITELAADPLYQLSTAGQEQFHTNMLYWLLTHQPEVTGPLMNTFGILPPQTYIYRTVVSREQKHIDLLVDSGMGCGKLVLENKLHSLPRAQQLREYQTALPGRYQNDETTYALLSLIEPTFTLPDPWRQFRYTQLLDPLRQAASALREAGNSPDGELVDRYVDLIIRLLAVRDAHNVTENPGTQVHLSRSERQRLRAARVLPLVEKMRITGFAQLMQSRINPSSHVDIGLTRTQGVAGHFTPGRSGHRFGWQYQGGQIRLAVLLDDKQGESWAGRRQDRELFVKNHFHDFFDFESVHDADHLLGPYTGHRLEWLGYEPDFVYTYRPVKQHVTYGELVDICSDLTRYADRYAAEH